MNESERDLLLKLASIVAGDIPAMITEVQPGIGKVGATKRLTGESARKEILELMAKVRTLAHDIE